MRTFLISASLLLSVCLVEGVPVSIAAAAPATSPTTDPATAPASAQTAAPATAPTTAPAAAPVAARLALVVGMNNYRSLPPLPQCPIAARNVAVALRDAGFEVSEAIDVSNAAMNATLTGFAQKAPPQSTLLVYYCGYAAAYNGRNFLVPVSAGLATPDRVMVEGIAASAVVSVLARTQAHAAVAVLDLAPAPGKSEPISESVLTPANAPPAVTTLAISQGVPGGLGNGLAERLRAPNVDLRSLVEQAQSDWQWQLGITLALINPPPADVQLRGTARANEPPATATTTRTSVEDTADAESQMSPAERRRVQSRLQRLGLYNGPIDGIFGDQTRTAIRSYQQANGLPQTGRLDITLASRLLFMEAGRPSR